MNSIKASALLCTALLSGLLAGCGKDDLVSTLTPARDIVGTWETSAPTKHFIKTDYCSASLQDVATQDRQMTLVITEAGENLVNVTYTYRGTNFTSTNPQCTPTGYVPDVSPLFLKGIVSSTRLTLVDSSGHTFGLFVFTTDLMEGTWDDEWCLAYCQKVYTSPNALKLTRKR